MINNKTISLGILSWKSPKTLEKTLTSYEKQNLFSLFDENIIYFNQISENDKKIAKKFNLQYYGNKENLGFLGGMENLAKSMKCEYLLMLQNDCPIVEDFKEAEKQITEAIQILEDNKINIMRLRHRFKVGEGFNDVENYLKYYPAVKIDKNFIEEEYSILQKNFKNNFKKNILRILRPFKKKQVIGRSIYIEESPDLLFPKYIKKYKDIFIVDSAVINFTEQSFLVKKDFLMYLINYIKKHPKKRTLNGFQVPEIILNCFWWRHQHFKIGVGKGLFTHNRFDGSFRKNHIAYDESSV